MRVALITPWDNAWVPYYKRAIEARGHQFICQKSSNGLQADVVLHGWAVPESKPIDGARNFMFLRRYELFNGGLGLIDWKKIDGLICVNTWIADRVSEIFEVNSIRTPVHMIYNGTDPAAWRYRERKPGKRIGMACHVHPKKNLPLALQILAALPEDYQLHVAGAVQDACTAEYLNHLAQDMRRRIYFYGHVDEMDLWWEQMQYCLSTSLSEGNPNNVIEAMAKGIKPIVHRWPGADDQFPGALFGTVDEAVAMIMSEEYRSTTYRDAIKERFSLSNIERVVDLALEPLQEAA